VANSHLSRAASEIQDKGGYWCIQVNKTIKGKAYWCVTQVDLEVKRLQSH